LAELNRIVAQHGRGLDVVGSGRTIVQRQEEPVMATAGGRSEPRIRDTVIEPPPRMRDPVAEPPRLRDIGSASTLPPPDLGGPIPRRTEAPAVSPVAAAPAADQGRDSWLSDLLNRADGSNANRDTPPPARARVVAPASPPSPASSAGANPLESLSLDIGRLMDRTLAAEMWDRYQRGESKAFTKRLYTPAGQKAFDEVARKYRADRNFKQTVDRYVTEFERLLDEVAREDRGPQALRNQLTSETGLVYTLLAHAAGRLG
jgi:hypothetical protein